ncbi:structural protein MipA [Sphingomonas sp. Ant20]|nr:structural protein MipA [Sphingomonas sp. Ant20]
MLATTVLVGVAAPAFAQDAARGAPDDMAARADADTITIGVGAAFVPDYEGSNNNKWSAAPVAIGTVGGFGFSVLGNRASIDLIPDKASNGLDFQAGPIGVLNFNRQSTKGIDDDRVRALGKIKTAIEVGGYVGVGKTGVITSPYDKLSVTLSYRHDVNNSHDSAIWQPTVSYLMPVSTKAALALFGSAEHAGRGYANTYFSITPTQSAVSTLPVYNASKGWKSYTLGGAVTYSLTGDLLQGFKLVAGGTYVRLLNDFADSPVTSIAGSKSQWLGAVGIGYTF